MYCRVAILAFYYLARYLFVELSTYKEEWIMKTSNRWVYYCIKIPGAILTIALIIISILGSFFILGIPFLIALLKYWRMFYMDEDYDEEYVANFRAWVMIAIAICCCSLTNWGNHEVSLIYPVCVLTICFIIYLGGKIKLDSWDVRLRPYIVFVLLEDY